MKNIINDQKNLIREWVVILAAPLSFVIQMGLFYNLFTAEPGSGIIKNDTNFSNIYWHKNTSHKLELEHKLDDKTIRSN